jgi:2-oxoglutarate ferredoxin oxidoreductase subunit alpha
MAMTEKRFRKMTTLLAELRAWEWELVRRHGDDDPEVLVLGWGSTWGPALEAVDLARAAGIRTAAVFPRLLSPLPEDELRAALEGPSLRHVLVPEVNYTGQFAELVKARFFDTFRARPELALHKQNLYGGLPFTAGEIHHAIRRAQASAAVPVTA